MFGTLAESGRESAADHGIGSYEFAYDAADTGHLVTRTEAVQPRETTFNLYVDGQQAYQWDGTGSLEISCLYPGDRVHVITEKGATSNLLTEHELGRALNCDLGFIEQFKFVQVDGNKVEISFRYNFDLAISPDGPGNEHGPVPLSNDWHFSKQYAGPIEGLGVGDKPVYLFIMVDNVHQSGVPDGSSVTNSGALGWDDPVPDGKDPVVYNYEVSGTTLHPIPNSTRAGDDGEPTNVVYMLFEPGCDQSRLKIAYYEGRFHNSIDMPGEEIVEDAHDAAPTDDNDITTAPVYEAPAIPCYEG